MTEGIHRVGPRAERWIARGPNSYRNMPLRVVLGRIVVNALALAFVVAIMPGVAQDAKRPVVGYLVASAVFGLINAFVKPAIQFVALPLLMGSLGMVVIVVNAVVFWLMDLLTGYIKVDGVGWVLLASLVLSTLSYVLENIFGLAPPIVSDREDDS